MKVRPPLLLAVPLIISLAYEVWWLVTQPSGVIAGHFALNALLTFFVLRGSRAAGIIWAILSFLSGLLFVFVAVKVAPAGPNNPLWYWALAVLLFANAAYVVFSPSVRAFQRGCSGSTKPHGDA